MEDQTEMKVHADFFTSDSRRKYRDRACSAYGDEDDHAFCFVGIDTESDIPWMDGSLVLDDSPSQKFPYSASCNVAYKDGAVTFLECSLPSFA